MRARTWIAGLAAAALATAGLVGAGTAADAAITTQSAGVSITVDATSSNTALVSSPTVANVTVKNNSASSTLGVFTVVVPAGVAPVQAVGVQGPGNWRQTVLPCGTTANCSALVLVYASLPLSSSVLRPGQSVTSSIRFTTPAAPTTLAFKFLGIGNGLFTTTDAPSINVVNGVAGSFCVTGPGNLVAGTTATFTVQAIADGSECAVTGRKIGIAATSMTVKFGTDDLKGAITATTLGVTPASGGSTTTFQLPASSTGLYTFTGTFKAAGNQSIGVATTAAGGNSSGFIVSPAAAASVNILSVANKNATVTGLAKGAVFVTTYEVLDAFGNAVLTPSASVGISFGTGTFTRTGGLNPVAGGPGATPETPILPADGTVDGTYDGTGPQTLTAIVGAASGTAHVSFAAASTGAAVLFPGASATIVTTGFSGGADPSCAATGTTCAGLSLGAGGTGAATFGVDTCAAAGLTAGCPTGSGAIVANLTADLKGPGGALYDQLNPAHMTYVCPLSRCGHNDGMLEYTTDDNRYAESVEDFNFHPFKYVLTNDTTVQTAVDCSAGLTQIPYSENKENLLVDPGTDTTIPGTPNQFHTCIDVHNLVRNAQGDLIYEVYFYDDYKGFVG